MMKMQKKTSVLMVLSALGAMAAPEAARAQRPEPAAELPTVTVTAQKREEQLLEIPAAVQSISGEQLEQSNMRDLQDVMRAVPGASQGRSTQAGTRSFQIRGVTSFYGDSTVGYYLDDAVFTILNRNWAPVGRTFDVNRIEVLRGPQGTLYGLGAMGGSVRFVTEDPDLRQTRVRGGVGYSTTNDGDPNWLAEAALSVPLSPDVLAARVVASKTHNGGYAESPTFPGDKNVTEDETLRIKLLARPTRDVTLRFGYQHSDNRDDKGNQLEYIPTPPPGTLTGRYPASTLLGRPVPTFNDTTTDVTSLYGSYNAGSVLLELSAGYVEATQSARIPVNNLILYSGLDASTKSVELRAVSQAKGPLQWIGGLMYLDAHSAEDVRLETGPTPPPAAPFLGSPTYAPLRNEVPTYDSRSWAPYGEVSYDLLDGRLTPLIGLRYFSDDRTFTDNQRLHSLLPVVPAPVPPCGTVPAFNPAACVVPASTSSTSATFDSWNPRFNLAYKIDDNSTTYLNIAKGFRSGVFNSSSTVRQTGLPAAVQPDSLWSYEIGGKASFSRTLYAEAAVYFIDWKDVQLNFNAPGFPPPPPQVVANVGDVEGYGLDYGINWIPLRGLTLSLTGNFNSTEWKRIANPAAFANTHIVVGEQLTTVPQTTYSLSGTYLYPLQEGYFFATYASYTYIGEQGDPSSVGQGPATRPAPLGDPQKLLNLRLGIEAEKWKVYFVGTNLLDHDAPYYISGSGYQRLYPRTLGVEVRLEL